MTVFDDFRKGREEAQPEQFSNTSEERLFVIEPASTSSKTTLKTVVRDSVGKDGYSKSIEIGIIECRCCGLLCSYDTNESKHKPPAARCQNPECRAFLCTKHSEERLSCVICGKPLCVCCARKSPLSDFVFCETHFHEYVEKSHLENIRKCLLKT
jgi:hypothetical protein